MSGITANIHATRRPQFAPAPDGLTEGQKKEMGKLKGLSQEYESFFMKQVVDAMRKTVPKDGYLNGGNAEEIYKGMMDEKLSEQMAKSGGSGIAENLYNTFSKAYLASIKAEKKTGEIQ